MTQIVRVIWPTFNNNNRWYWFCDFWIASSYRCTHICQQCYLTTNKQAALAIINIGYRNYLLKLWKLSTQTKCHKLLAIITIVIRLHNYNIFICGVQLLYKNWDTFLALCVARILAGVHVFYHFLYLIIPYIAYTKIIAHMNDYRQLLEEQAFI